MQVVKITSRIGRMMCWPKSRYKGAGEQYPVEELPLRAELWNVEQLERHARTIAGIHRLSTQKADDKLLPRLMENERILITTYDQIAAAAARNRRIVPAAEWLLDNFYLIEEQIRSTRACCLDLTAVNFRDWQTGPVRTFRESTISLWNWSLTPTAEWMPRV
jgi:hypothetical protein